MDNNFDTFILFYTAFHEGELTLTEMRKGIVDEIGEDGLNLALIAFKTARLGLKNTYYESRE